MIRRLFEAAAHKPARAVVTLAIAYILSMVISVGASVYYNDARAERGRCLTQARDLQVDAVITALNAAIAVGRPLKPDERAEIVADYQAQLALAGDIRATC